jgi:hypothetical protein
VVGISNTPRCGGNGGRILGFPRFPSKLSINDVSSPQITLIFTFVESLRVRRGYWKMRLKRRIRGAFWERGFLAKILN